MLSLFAFLACAAVAGAETIKVLMALGPPVPGSEYQLYQEKIIPQRIMETVTGIRAYDIEVIPHTNLVKPADVIVPFVTGGSTSEFKERRIGRI